VFVFFKKIIYKVIYILIVYVLYVLFCILKLDATDMYHTNVLYSLLLSTVINHCVSGII